MCPNPEFENRMTRISLHAMLTDLIIAMSHAMHGQPPRRDYRRSLEHLVELFCELGRSDPAPLPGHSGNLLQELLLMHEPVRRAHTLHLTELGQEEACKRVAVACEMLISGKWTLTSEDAEPIREFISGISECLYAAAVPAVL